MLLRRPLHSPQVQLGGLREKINSDGLLRGNLAKFRHVKQGRAIALLASPTSQQTSDVDVKCFRNPSSSSAASGALAGRPPSHSHASAYWSFAANQGGLYGPRQY